ncbi:MAG: hypothetical protein JO343_02825 [Candidatus Eremiobacteraeota bacterium]|nr:hypothetical protein [Candidatus Eremiobacteraeota bacterium]MBV8460117.1 hypothetical protein [Candidatus Eremiobacteraeota bacterium]MBV8668419.1 hypothetical protein [Candidatus Eremiobacteraeota bacterium]
MKLNEAFPLNPQAGGVWVFLARCYTVGRQRTRASQTALQGTSQLHRRAMISLLTFCIVALLGAKMVFLKDLGRCQSADRQLLTMGVVTA